MIRNWLLAGAYLVTTSACSSVQPGTPIPKTPEEKLAIANKLAVLFSDEKTANELIDTIGRAGLPSNEALCKAAPENAKADCLSVMTKARPQLEAAVQESLDKSKTSMPDVMQNMAIIMVDLYTPAELAKMIDFYSSAEGQAISRKQPEVMKRLMAKVSAQTQADQVELAGKIRTVIEAAFAAENAEAAVEN